MYENARGLRSTFYDVSVMINNTLFYDKHPLD